MWNYAKVDDNDDDDDENLPRSLRSFCKDAFSNILESKSSSTRPETKLVSILAKSDGCGVSFLKTLIS